MAREDRGQGKRRFGARLAELRKKRRMSQLSLSLDAEVSTRHISFLETGRSIPTREMVARLSGALNLDCGERQTLMRSAGFWEQPRYLSEIKMAEGHAKRDLDTIIAIEASADAEEAVSLAARALARIGLEQFFTGTMRRGGGAGTVSITHHHLAHAPLGWMLHYRDCNYASIDPLVRATGQRHMPFFWSDLAGSEALHAPGVVRMFEDGREFRISNGFVMPIHRPDGSIHALSAMTGAIDTNNPETRAIARVVATALLHRLDAPGSPDIIVEFRLAPCERDCLLYVLEGRSRPELANRLSMNEESTAQFLSRICMRFGTSGPLEAALRARRLGALAP